MQVVEHLLAQGADIHAAKDDGASALHLSALRKHTATTALLIARGADVNARNAHRETSLHQVPPSRTRRRTRACECAITFCFWSDHG